MTSRPPVPEDLRRRLTLYAKSIKLHETGLSARQIGQELGVSEDAVRLWLAGHKPKRVKRYEPDLAPSRDLAYVAGFYLGDGKDAGAEHKVRFELADREQTEYVGGLVAKILGRGPKPLGRDGVFYTIDYDSVALSNFLNQEVEKLIDYFVGFTQAFLQGFFDAEGYASCSVDLAKRRILRMVVGLANTNLGYLASVERLLTQEGVESKMRRTNRAGQEMTIRGHTWVRKHDVYHIQISSCPSIARFHQRVGFRNREKAEKLSCLVKMIPMKPGQRFVWFTTYYAKKGRKWLKIEKIGSNLGPAGRNLRRPSALLSRRHSGDCGLSRLNGSADGRPLQPEACGPFGSTRLSYCGTVARPLKIS